MTCHRFSAFVLSGNCTCGRNAELHFVTGEPLFCGDCCPVCRVAKPFDDEPLPEGLAGEQEGLWEK